MASAGRVRAPAFAKVNLSLLVLHKRGDGYHEIRTVMQTVSLADRIEIEWTPDAPSGVNVAATVPIEGKNLAASAAENVLRELRLRGSVTVRIDKRIPMGAGLGGGSSDAAAVLLALPVLCRRAIAADRLAAMAAELGSDVPFFLTGGTALATGRGTEVYPLPEAHHGEALLVKPAAGVATAGAYAALNRPVTELTSPEADSKIGRFQSLVRMLDCPETGESWKSFSENDFEAAVLPRQPELAEMVKRLGEARADLVRMTGSGSALFALFRSRIGRERAGRRIKASFPGALTEPVRFVTRKEYRAAWRKALGGRMEVGAWPPRGRDDS
ncbi:MAG: 4-(cytidine 5'-diphospho)-2-C-methyl-D-erythritol kinase [Bryobacteraceae bacterium]